MLESRTTRVANVVRYGYPISCKQYMHITATMYIIVLLCREQPKQQQLSCIGVVFKGNPDEHQGVKIF